MSEQLRRKSSWQDLMRRMFEPRRVERPSTLRLCLALGFATTCFAGSVIWFGASLLDRDASLSDIWVPAVAIFFAIPLVPPLAIALIMKWRDRPTWWFAAAPSRRLYLWHGGGMLYIAVGLALIWGPHWIGLIDLTSLVSGGKALSMVVLGPFLSLALAGGGWYNLARARHMSNTQPDDAHATPSHGRS